MRNNKNREIAACRANGDQMAPTDITLNAEHQEHMAGANILTASPTSLILQCTTLARPKAQARSLAANKGSRIRRSVKNGKGSANLADHVLTAVRVRDAQSALRVIPPVAVH